MKTKPKKDKKERSLLQINIAFTGPTLTQKVLFAKNLSVMLQSGMTLIDGLYTLQGSVSGKFSTILTKIIKKVESGVPFSESLSKYPKVFPEFFINMARAGENSGTLPQNLENIARQLKKERDLITKIRGAMIYPIIILVATFFLSMAIAFFILPEILPLFNGLEVDLPFTTKMLIAFTNLMQERGLTLLIGTVVTFFILAWILKRKFSKPFIHWFYIKIPIIKKITKYANLSRFNSTLGNSLKSGITIDEALEITHRSINNYYYKKEVERISKKVKSGAKLSNELIRSQELFPNMMTRMLKVGEESGRFEKSLLYLADFYEDEVNNSIKTFTTLLEPLLLLFIGSLVGFLALSIISPIYDITGNIQR